MSDFIDKLAKQTKKRGQVDIVVDSKTYEKELPAKWFYSTVIAGIEVTVTDHYGPEFADHIGFIIWEDDEIVWLKFWE